MNRFSTGNLETLQIPNILDELKKFYEKHYSSNLMNLVLVSKYSLDELQKFVETNFSEVKNQDLPAKDFKDEVIFDRAHSFGRIYKIIPKKNLKVLKLTWILPPSALFSVKKSSFYLSHVIGHEGPNSLLSQLINEGLAQKLSAGHNNRMNQSFDQFNVQISLTQEGENNIMKVIERVYMFINQIREEGAKDYIYEEFQQKNEIDFENLSKSKALGYSNALARRLNFMPHSEDSELVGSILQAPYSFKDFDKEDIQNRMNLLVPDNMFVILNAQALSKEKAAKPDKFQQEYYYSSDFAVEEIS